MKKNLMLLAIFSLSINAGIAQKWKEKLKAAQEKVDTKLNEAVGNKDYSSEFEGAEFEDMMNHVDSWNGKTVDFYIYEARDLRYYKKKPVKVEVVKDGDTFKYVKIGDWKYTPVKNPDSDKITKFKGTPGALYFTKEKIVAFYEVKSEEEERVGVKHLYGTKEPARKIEAEISAYLKYTRNLINADVAAATKERARIAAEKAAARKAEFGLHDKKIKSVKIVASLPAKNGNFTKLSYHIETTLTNGKVISSNKGGFLSDYEITKNVETDFSGIIQTGFIPGDQVVISAVCKHDKSKKAEAKLTVDYNVGANFLLYGRGWTSSAGENGDDVEIELKQENHAVTGKPVIRVRLKSTAARAPLSEFTVSPTETIYVKTKGGDGGIDDGKHYNGGDGGDITVYKDPSVKTFRIKYDTNGGKPGGRMASSGRDGRYSEKVQAVSF